MSTTAVSAPGLHATRAPRAIAFRIVAGIVAVVFLVLFGVWPAVLAPWLATPDSGDHGWQRTAELHVLADAAGGILMLAVGVAALLLVVRPLQRSALVLWVACALAVMSIGTATSTLVQGHAGFAGAALNGLVLLCLFAVPLVLLHPERRLVLSGKGPTHGGGPSRPLVVAFVLVGTAALAGAVAVVWWRISGGLFENPAEDDAVSLAMLGVSLALGCALCARGRQGWRLLALVIAGMLAYCAVAGLTVAVS